MTAGNDDHDHHKRPQNDAREVLGLRLALGSILSPRRYPCSPSSTSGTASPAIFSFPHPHSVPPAMHHVYDGLYAYDRDNSSHDNSPLPRTPPHSPIRLPISRSESHKSEMNHHADHHDSYLATHHPAGGPTIVVTINDANVCPKTKASYLATLQSKSAWDALIHGSFS